MRPSCTPRSPMKLGLPVPSTIRAFLISRSSMGPVFLSLTPARVPAGVRCRTVYSRNGLRAELGAHQPGSGGERGQLAERHVARQVLHPAVRGGDEALRGDALETGADPCGHLLGCLHLRIREV